MTDLDSEIKFLKEAQESNMEAEVALSMLKITYHKYTVFVYDVMLLNRNDTVENILKELKLVDNSEMLNTIENLEQTFAGQDLYSQTEGSIHDSTPTEIICEIGGYHRYMDISLVRVILERMGVKYIPQLEMYNSNLLLNNDLKINK